MTDHSELASDVVGVGPGLQPIVRLLVVARAVNRLGAFSLPFLAVLLTEQRGWSTAEVGLTLTAFGLATLPSRLIGGRLSESLGRRRTIVLGLTGCAASQLALAVTTSGAATVCAVVALGLAFEIYEPPSQALVADHVAAEDQVAAYGLMTAALAAAGMAAGGLSIVLSSVDLRWLFVADALTCAGCALILRVALPADTTTASRAASDAFPWRDRRLLVLVAIQTVFAVIYLQSTIALPLSLLSRGQPSWSLGVLLTTSAITMVALQLVLRRSRYGTVDPRAGLVAGYLLLAVALGGYAVSTTLPAYVVWTVVLGAGDLLLAGQLLAMVAGLAPENARARYLAVFGLSWGVAAVIAPAVGTGLIAVVGVGPTWWVLAGVCVGLAAITGTTTARVRPNLASCEASPPSRRPREPTPSPSTATISR